MALLPSNPIEQQQRDRKSDRFLDAFRLTENGKVKSTLLLYSFFLCLVFIGIYAALYVALINPLHTLTEGAGPVAVNLLGALLPAAAGTGICALVWPLTRRRERRMMLAAFCWMAVLALASFIALELLLLGEGTAQLLAAQFFSLMVLPPTALGLAVSILLFYFDWKKRRAGPAGTPGKERV